MTQPRDYEAPRSVMYEPPRPSEAPDLRFVRVVDSVKGDRVSYRTGHFPRADRRMECNVNTWVKWRRRKSSYIRPLTEDELAQIGSNDE